MLTQKKYAPAYKHAPIEKLFNDVYWVHGSVKMAPGMTINRNMVILKQGADLFLINPVRLEASEEQQLKKLGKVKAILRLGDFHGLDDAYYIDTFKAEFWCQAGQTSYPSLKPDHIIDEHIASPIDNTEFFIFSSAKFPESALLLKTHKLLITTDSVQHWTNWSYTTWSSRLLLRMMGFSTTLLIGKPWLKRVTPKGESMLGDFEKIFELDFDNLLAAHGSPLLGGAKEKLRHVVTSVFKRS